MRFALVELEAWRNIVISWSTVAEQLSEFAGVSEEIVTDGSH